MAAQWYCLIGQQQYGPFSSEQIQQLVQQGQVQREHYLRTETDSQWTPAGDLPGLFPAPQSASSQPPAPFVTSRPKKNRVALPPAAVASPTASAPVALPQARPVPPAAAPVAAAPRAAAPAAPIAATPVAAVPVTAVPVAAPAAMAVPVAAVPVTAAAAPTAAPAASPAPAVRAGGKPTSTARPIPLYPSVPTAAPSPPARDAGGAARKPRSSRQKSQLMVGGLGAALVLLIVIAVVVLNRSPGKASPEGPGRATASAPGEIADPSSNPEIDPATVVQPSSEPKAIADPVPDVPDVPAAAAEAVAKPKANPLPAVGKWLDATRQKGGLRDIVRLGVGNAWLDAAAGRPTLLTVEILITNLSPDDPMEFSGWSPEKQPQPESRAMLADEAGVALQPAPSRTAAARRSSRHRIAAGESLTEQLCFLFPESDSKQFRLVLPYAALGQTGHLGFEMPRQMIKQQAPGAKEAPDAKPAPTAPETLLPASDTVKPAPGEPETMRDLRSQIEGSEDAKTEPMKDTSKPAEDDPFAPAMEPKPERQLEAEPEKIPDIRKLIEEEDSKTDAMDEGQGGEAKKEAPKSP